MRSSIKNNAISENTYERGFSLVELALVLLVIGLVLTPAIAMYHQYRVDKDWDTTEYNIAIVDNSIGGFRNVFGRYPCPASTTAAPGDLTYGHENCLAPAPGNCNNGICTYTNATSGLNVIVGAFPYKTVNIEESEAYNSSMGRLTYAVTANLTSNTTYTPNGGGISIVDKTDPTKSLVFPDSSAHFVVLSHGHNQAGAFSRSGVIGSNCASGSAIEQENCDADAVFTSGDYEENSFDDRVEFFSAVEPSEWQTSQPDPNAIALKSTDSIAIGSNIGQDLSNGDQTMVLQVGANSGTARTSTRFVSERLCEYGATTNLDCFQPELIAGSLTNDGTRLEAETVPGNGISCYKPGVSQDNYMIGIADGDILCADEIFASCPTGSFVQEIDASGNVICRNGLPAPACADDTVTGLCGVPKLVTGTFSGNHSVTYGGECRKITDHNSAYFATGLAGLDAAGITSFINGLNAEVRTIVACDDSAANSQVRDAWLCTSGTWSASPVVTHEKSDPWSTYPSNVAYTGGNWPAENYYSGTDPNNTDYTHDCWCREDYRVQDRTCPGGLTGTQKAIQKHTCPQTNHQWTDIYISNDLCACAPGTTYTTQSCDSYYDDINVTSGTTGLTNSVIKTFNINCVAGDTVTDTTPSSIDTSACACPSNSQIVNRTFCSSGLTNSWSWAGGNETGVATLSTLDWICPGTTSNGLPDPGLYGSVTPFSPIPACTCDSGLSSPVTIGCPTGQQGVANGGYPAGITYTKEWDCTLNSGLGGWEPQANWDLVANNCHGCKWQVPNGPPTTGDFTYGVEKGSYCSCGASPAEFCHTTSALHDYWTGCPCVVQN